jgi:hypothetical protein
MKKVYNPFIILLCFISFRSFAQCTTAATIPYYEDFQSITTTNQLPACWTASNPSVTCLTFTNGGSAGIKHAAFYYLPSGTNYFYTRSIQLNAGIIYSVSLWYNAGVNPGTDWTNLSVLLGTSQSTTGLISIASTSGPVVANVYTALSNTFMVANSAVYYLAIRGTNNGLGSTQYLNWDDLVITIPCTGLGAANSPTISLSPPSATICNGSSVTISANGADTYSWSTGANTPTVSLTGQTGFGFTNNVVGTNTLTGCTSTKTISVAVNPAPVVNIIVSPPAICLGSTGILNAIGATNYTWSNNQQIQAISVSPTISTTYTVTGSNTYGCTDMSTALIVVYPLPTITVSGSSSSQTICAGEQATLNAGGANVYQWNSTVSTLSGSQVTVCPNASITYSVIGTDNNNCSSQTIFQLHVAACTGLKPHSAVDEMIKVYPNPCSEELTIEFNNQINVSISLTDITGRMVFNTKTKSEKVKINVENLPKGIYYTKVESARIFEIIKVVKQ